jgi:hypothetical protein
MGLGLNAYNHRIGERATGDKLIAIFDTGPDVEPVSVGEQRAYFEAAWEASRR